MTIARLDSQPGYIGPPADWPIAPETWWKMRAIILEYAQDFYKDVGDDEPEPDEPGKRHFKPCSRSNFNFPT